MKKKLIKPTYENLLKGDGFKNLSDEALCRIINIDMDYADYKKLKGDFASDKIAHLRLLWKSPSPTKSPTLTIKKLTRTRAGKEYHTTQFIVKGKIVGHQFNTKQSRDKSLTRFIKYIQDGDFKIVKG